MTKLAKVLLSIGVVAMLVILVTVLSTRLESYGNREFSRGLLTMALKTEQETFVGERDPNGCFELPRRDNHQTFIQYHQFSAEELGQTFDQMFCWGGLFPAEF